MCPPWPRTFVAWRETWRGPAETLEAVEQTLKAEGAVVRRGGDFDHWDLEVRSGVFGSSRLTMAIEEHGAGRQLVRFGVRPRVLPAGIALVTLFASLAGVAATDGAPLAAGILGAVAAILGLGALGEGGGAMASVTRALRDLGAK
jgi:hypothetical protein